MIAETRTDADLLRLAAVSAREFSDDPRTQNGAVLARRNEIVVWAANTSPTVLWSKQRSQPPQKYTYIEHAERAAIYKAAMAGWATGGASLYCVWFACPDCARAIIAAGIYEVVGHAATRNATPERWLAAVLTGESMLREAGVSLRWLAEPLGVKILFDGKEMSL